MKMANPIAPILIAALLATGCASVETTKSFNGLALASGKQNVCHLYGHVSGLYCFSIPLISGDTDTPGSFIPVFFRDSVSLDGVADMVSAEARGLGSRELLDVTSESSNYWIMPLWIFFWRVQTMTANGVR